jgi:acyl carrier protein
MDTLVRVRKILRDALNLGDRAENLTPESPLLGGLPEFDSMAVVTVVTMIEDELGVTIDDDELSAEIFATVGSLAEFLSQKAAA